MRIQPAQNKLIETNFAAASQVLSNVVDSFSWGGSTQADFAENRSFGWPLLDVAVKLTAGQCDVNVNYLNPVFPINNVTPAFVSNDLFITLGAVVSPNWGDFSFRPKSRFWQLRLIASDTISGYVVAWIRAQ